MLSRSYVINRKKKQYLIIKWEGDWENISVFKNKVKICDIEGKNELMNGKSILDDDRSILIQLKGNKPLDLYASINNIKLKPAPKDPYTKISVAIGVVFFIAGINILLGIINILTNIEILQNLGDPFVLFIYGIIFMILGVIIKIKNSMIALLLAITLFIIDAVLSIIFNIQNGAPPFSGTIFMKAFLAVYMINGINGFKQLKGSKSKNIQK